MTLSEYICGANAEALQRDELLLETTRRSQRVRTRQSLLSLALVSLVAAGYMWSLWFRTDRVVLTVWVLIIIALTAWRSSISKRVRKNLADAEPLQLVQNEAELVFTGVSLPLIIGSGYWLFCVTGDSVTILAVSLLCCLYAVGSTVNTVAQRRMQGLMVSLNLGQGVLFFISNEMAKDYAVAIQVLALILLLLGFGKTIQDMFVELVKSDLEIKAQNERLLQNRIEIENALEEAVNANKTKSQFLAAASHDLSQPLHAMSMFIGNLKQTLKGDEKQQLLVSRIESTSKILKQQFDGLLDLSRYDAGGVTVQEESFDLRALCELLVQGERQSAAEKNIELLITGSPVNVISDPVLLGRLVGNLLANAIKFTDQGSVEIALREMESQVMLSVSDTGCGFSDIEKDRIFTDFVQLDNSARNRSKGAGLGLSIVQRISALLKVELEVKSTPGFGSVFTLVIPIVKPGVGIVSQSAITDGENSTPETNLKQENAAIACEDYKQFQTREEPRPVDLSGLNILIVDDDANILEALSAYVRGRGGVAFAASTPEAALRYCESEIVNFAIVDDMLGEGETGLELALTISHDIAIKHVIIVTGNIMPDRMQILRSSVFGIFSKPLYGSELEEILSDRLNLADRQTKNL